MTNKTFTSQETAAKLKTLIKEIPKNERADAARLDELRRLFAGLIQQGDLTFKQQKSTKAGATEKWNTWLQRQHKRCISQLTTRIASVGRRTAVRTLWGLIAASPHVTPNGNPHVHADLLFEWLQALVAMPSLDVTEDKPMLHLLEAELGQRDVQYYALRCITRWAKETYHRQKRGVDKEEDEEDDNVVSKQEQSERMLRILMMIPFPTTQEALQKPTNRYLFAPPNSNKKDKSGSYEDAEGEEEEESDSGDSEEDSDESEEEDQPPSKKRRKNNSQKNAPSKTFAFQDVKCHLNALSKAWIAILRLPLSTATLKEALPFVSTHILPKIRHPLQFADLYMQAYSGASGIDDHSKHKNSIIPLLALDGLFYLMTQHQLEYPEFYTQLYALLRPKLFYVKYRTRFFALLQKCLLRNEMLPAHLVAAFLKRLLQGALQAPPGAALFVLALSSNLLRQHEECAALIHRDVDELKDPYDGETDDPVQSKALQSSLWELNALECHYLPAVATLAQSIGREDPKSPMLQLDEMAAHSYTSLIEQERKRKVKTKRKTYDKNQKPTTAVTFVKPTGLFTSNDIFAGVLKVPTSSSSEKE